MIRLYMFTTGDARHGVSLDVVKATIRDLFDKLDKNSRWDLVGWMNRVELDAGKILD